MRRIKNVVLVEYEDIEDEGGFGNLEVKVGDVFSVPGVGYMVYCGTVNPRDLPSCLSAYIEYRQDQGLEMAVFCGRGYHEPDTCLHITCVEENNIRYGRDDGLTLDFDETDILDIKDFGRYSRNKTIAKFRALVRKAGLQSYRKGH